MRRSIRRPGDRGEHPAPGTLSRYLDGELTGDERGTMERHVSECFSCRRELRSLEQTIRGLDALRPRASVRLADEMVAALRRATSPQLSVVSPDNSRALAPRALGSWLHAAVRYCLKRSQLRLTAPIGLVLGAVLSGVNQGAMLLERPIDVGMCAVCALDFLLPFVAMNAALVIAGLSLIVHER